MAERRGQLAELSGKASELGETSSLNMLAEIENKLRELETASELLQDDLQQQLAAYANYKNAQQEILEWSMDLQLKLPPLGDLSGSLDNVKSRLASAQVLFEVESFIC